MRIGLAVLSTSLLASTAVAEPREAPAVTTSASPTYELGVRIGGYGFRREGDPRPGEGWTECRMNGLGVFGERRLGSNLFVEAGLDYYFSESFPQGRNEQDLPIDRMSGLITTALGVRVTGPWRTSGYAQLGVASDELATELLS